MALISERTRGDGSVNVDEISDALGIDREEGLGLAEHLDAIGWAALRREAEPRLWLTELGYQKMAVWRLPTWKRWPNEHPWMMTALVTTSTGIVYTLITAWLLSGR